MGNKKKIIRNPRNGNQPFLIDSGDIPQYTSKQIKTLVEDLQIHQVELETQIEELKRTQDELQRSRDKYQTLYDSIPVGHLTIDSENNILEANTTAVKMLGTPRLKLLKSKFNTFIAHTQSAQDRIHLFLRSLWTNNYLQKIEIEMQRSDGNRFFALLETSLMDKVTYEDKNLHIAITDISQRKQIEDSLSQYIQRLNTHMDNTPLAVIEFNSRFQVTRWSKEAERMFGWSSQEILGRSISEMRWVYDDDKELVKQVSADYISGKKSVETRINRNYRKDGTVIWCEWYNSVIHNSRGEIISILSQVLDITERKQAEEAIRQREERFRILTENLYSGVALIDEHGQFILVNPGFLKMFGTSPNSPTHDICGQDFDAWKVFEEDGQTLLPVDEHPVRKAVLTGQPVKNRLVGVQAPSGSELIWIIINAEPILKPDGTLQYLIATYYDITERKKLEIELGKRTVLLEKTNQQLALEIKEITRLKDIEERLKTLMDHNPSLVFVKDEKGRYVYLNKAYEKTFVGSKEWCGKTDFDLWPKESAELFRKDDAEVFESGQTRQFLEDSTDLTGVRHCWICYKFRFTDSNGKKYLGGIGIDAIDRIRVEEALRESEAKANALIKYAPTGIYEIDFKTQRMISVNEAASVLSGYSHEELLSMNLADMLTEESKKLFAERVKHQLAGEKIEDKVDYEVIKKDGSIIYVTLNMSFSKEKPYTALVIGHDVTERKKNEEVLKESEERLRLAQTGANVGMWDWDITTGVSHPSAVSQRLFGLEPDTIKTYSDWRKTIHPDDLIKFEAQRDKAILNHQPFDEEYRVIHPSGEIHWINAKGQAYYNEKGKPVRVMGITIDITERKKAEEALARYKDELKETVQQRTEELWESEEKYRLLVENSNEGIVVGVGDKFKFVNQRMEELLGYSREELLSMPHINTVHPDDRGIVAKVDAALSKGEKGFPKNDMRLICKNGDIKWIEINMLQITWEGQPAVLGMMIDITDRKRLEQSLKEYAQKITRVQEEERKKIAYELHDDTAQYLAILKLQLDSIIHSGEIQSPKLLEKLEYLEKDAGRAVDDIRRYSHELRPGVLEHLGLQAALEQVAEDHNKLGQMRVEVNVEGAEPELSEDIRLGLFRIAQEALNNCRKHAKAEKAVINLGFSKKHLKMIVSDNGKGFDVKQSTSDSKGKGSLGLMSMQERANLIGAYLKVESIPGKGTTVTVEIPLQINLL